MILILRATKIAMRKYANSFSIINTDNTMFRWSSMLSGAFLALSMVLSFSKLVILVSGNGSNEDLTEADKWLSEIGLKEYRPLFKQKGM